MSLGLLALLLLILLPLGYAGWQLLRGLGSTLRRGSAGRRVERRMLVLWRDDPAPDLFRLWLIGWPPALPRFLAGQHVMLGDPARDPARRFRAYSLAAWHRLPLVYVLAIRRNGGSGLSAHLHTAARPLRHLTLRPPRGHFTDPDPKAPLVLVAGGIGITPFRALLAERLAHGRAPITLHHTARTGAELLWRDEFARLAASHPAAFTYRPRETATAPRLTAAEVLQDAGDTGQIMVCAGAGLTDSLREGLLALGLPETRFHSELFSLATEAVELGITITAPTGQSFRPGPAGSLLEALEQAGLAPDSECRAGDCGLCEVVVGVGEVRDLRTGTCRTGRCLACSVLPVSDLVLQ